MITYIIHDHNQGLPKSLNDGMRHSHGSFITWISHDNTYKSNAIEKMAIFLKNNSKFVLVSSGHENIGDISSIFNGVEYTNETIISQFHGIVGFMYRREVVKKIGFYDEELVGMEDYDYWVRILELSPHSSGCIPDILCCFRHRPDQMTHKVKDKYGELRLKLLSKRENRLLKNPIDMTT